MEPQWIVPIDENDQSSKYPPRSFVTLRFNPGMSEFCYGAFIFTHLCEAEHFFSKVQVDSLLYTLFHAATKELTVLS